MKKVHFIVVAMCFFAILTHAQSWVITPQTGDANNPPYDLTAYIGTYIGNTFHETKYLTPQNSYRYYVKSNSEICYAYVFFERNPGLYSQSFKTAVVPHNGTAGELMLNIPSAGNYVFLVVTSGVNTDSCTVILGMDTYNTPVCNNYYSYSQGTDQPYNTFTCNSFMDTQLYVVAGSDPGTIVAYNDDYLGTSDYSWGGSSRVHKTYTNATSGVIVTMNTPSIPPTSPLYGLSSLYLGCKDVPSYTQQFFHNLKQYDGIISAPMSTVYNCISWAGGEWDHWEWPPHPSSDYYNAIPLVAFDNYFASRNRYRYGGTIMQDPVIDLWAEYDVQDTTFTHASVSTLSNPYALGFAWESKAGSLERFFHPRNSLHTNPAYVNDGYGEICLSYFKIGISSPSEMSEDEMLAQSLLPDTTEFIPSVFENIQFTAYELATISKMADAIAISDESEFINLYDIANDIFIHSPISSLDKLSSEKSYQALQSFCKSHPSVMPLIYLRLDKGDIMATKLIGDILIPAYPSHFEQMRNYIKNHRITKDGLPLRRTLQSNTTLFVKSLLADSDLPAQKNAKEGVTFSTDSDCFNVDVRGFDVDIKLALESTSKVHLNVTTLNGRLVEEIFAGSQLENGQYQMTARLPGKGSYIVTCIINSRIYSRKVSVR